MREPPQTDEGWFALHDFRSIDWDAWRDAPERERERAIEAGVEFLQACEDLADAEEGATGVFSILGDKADLLIMHFRPSLDDLSALERRFESTALGAFTEQTDSYLSVTEASGYTSDAWFEGDREEMDTGLRRYMERKLYPDLPDGQYVSFYPMSKRRGEEHNWYDLPFEERADLMAGHGEIGREFAGKIRQIIASSVGLDDHEWGVTLFAEDPTDLKDIVYEMRFDEASSKYGEFGQFFTGRRFPPADLGAYLRGERVPTSEYGADHPHGEGGHHGADHAGSTDSHHGADEAHGSHGESDHGEGDHGGDETTEERIRGELADLDIYAGQPHGEDVYATVLYSEADADELFDEVEGLRSNFEHYGTHVKTAVYSAHDRDRNAVVSIWETASAADTAAGFLADLPEIVSRAGEESGFGTMGMFYTVKPEHREEFVEKFDAVGDLLGDMDGHQETDLMVNLEDENDMFIASQWRSRDDAMAFFRSDAFGETVSWGRDVLADRPRHVFLS
ncbi:MAG: heme-binding protein [Haloferacaceae archaeon]